jgi:hypothetical protein
MRTALISIGIAVAAVAIPVTIILIGWLIAMRRK